MNTRADCCKIYLVVSVVLLASATSLGQDTKRELSLTILAQSTKVVKGTPVRIYVELTNQGNKDVLVSRRLSAIEGDGASLNFHVFNEGNKESPHAMGVTDYHGSSHIPLPLAVLSTWVALPPKATYRVERELVPSAFDFLGEPGTYRISASYLSSGIRGQVALWHLVDVRPQDIEDLPFQAWEGTLESNSTWIKVVK